MVGHSEYIQANAEVRNFDLHETAFAAAIRRGLWATPRAAIIVACSTGMHGGVIIRV